MKAMVPLLFVIIMLPAPLSGSADDAAAHEEVETYASVTSLDSGVMATATGATREEKRSASDESSKPNSMLMLALIIALLVLPFMLKTEPSEE